MTSTRLSEQESGETLVEVLIAISILGIAVAALMFGLATNVTTSVSNRTQSEGIAALNAAAEYVKSLTQTDACSATSATAVPASEVNAPAGFTITYGPAAGVGTDSCSTAAAVPVAVSGRGFTTLGVTVVKRG